MKIPFLPFVCFLLGTLSVFSQNAQMPLTQFGYETDHPGWYRFHPHTTLSPHTIVQEYRYWFGLGPEDSFEPMQIQYDELGFSHHYYQLYHRGIPVEHAVLGLHSRRGRVETMNGFVPRLSGQGLHSLISSETALQAGLSAVPAQQYHWEVPFLEKLKQETEQDPSASWYPTPSLLLVDTDFDWQTEQYVPAYKMEIATAMPHGGKIVYIHAQNGSVIKTLDLLQTENVVGIAQTRYAGSRPVTTDSVAQDSFRLRDYTRAAGGIETLDMNNGTNLNNAVDFWDADNLWDNANANFDEVAGDVHWGTAVTYDYFLQRFGRDSYDGKGTRIPSFVHINSKSYINAFWNISYAAYGDGAGSPLTDLDIVGHEFAHGLIRNSIGNLVYIDEGGSLNEGYADIFGNCVQAFGDSATFDWRQGEQSGHSLRSMARPKQYSSFNGPYPDTYKGDGWYTGNEDNGGAHLNSTVFSHWFYLMAEGDTGTNDKGQFFDVSGIGIEPAANIAYRMLTVYLTPTAQFADARQAALQAAEDLYGLCSPEHISATNAWYAVGLGAPVLANDFRFLGIDPLGNCGLGNEMIHARFQYQGCDSIPAGTSYVVQVTTTEPVQNITEPLTLTQTLYGGELLEHTFGGPIDLSGFQDHQLRVTIFFPGDPNQANDQSPVIPANNREVIQEGLFTFEAPDSQLVDTFFWEAADRMKVRIVEGLGKDSTQALMMEGSVGFAYRFVDAFPLWGGPPVDYFDFNADYTAEACLCINAEALSQLHLTFDLRQTFSTYYKSLFVVNFNVPPDSVMPKRVNTLRVKVDDTEVARFRPLTKTADPWTNHTLNLDAYAGSAFRLCFEGKTVFDQLTDPQGIGDRIFLDNISLLGINTSLPTPQGMALDLFPNPAREQARLTLSLGEPLLVRIELIDMHGKHLWNQQSKVKAGDTEWGIPLRNLSSGIYVVRVLTEKGHLSRRLVVE